MRAGAVEERAGSARPLGRAEVEHHGRRHIRARRGPRRGDDVDPPQLWTLDPGLWTLDFGLRPRQAGHRCPEAEQNDPADQVDCGLKSLAFAGFWWEVPPT